jgi:anti-sigma B factor antagonist
MSFFYIGDDLALEDTECDDDLVVLLAGGQLDFAAGPQLRERIAEQIDAGCKQLVLDLSAATFIDSSVIGVLVGAAVRLRNDGGSLAVVCPAENRSVVRIFEITGVSNVFELYRTRDEALSAFGWVG